MEDRGFIVDPGGEPETISSPVFLSGVQLDAILITHGHQDHIAAAAELKKETGADIYGSSEVDAVLTEPQRFQLFPGLPEVKRTSVDYLLAGGEELDIGGIPVTVVATPGHSRGSLCFYAGGNLFTGDLLFHGSVGRSDLPGGSFEELEDSVRRLMRMFPPDTVVYPGHGNETTLGKEKEENIFLKDMDW